MKLAILYKNKLLLEKNKNKIKFIEVPKYFSDSDDFADISNFITLLCAGIMDDNYNSQVKANYSEWADKNETYFFPEVLVQIDEDTYVYNLDEAISDSSILTEEIIDKNFKNAPSSLVWKSYDELKKKEDITKQGDDETTNYAILAQETFDKDILKVFDVTRKMRSNKDVLLLYSGGKDSTLSAIRLKNMGYNPYFIHFDNGSMLDVDKPFLTFQKSFEGLDAYHFPYEYSDVDISKLFLRYFEDWQDKSNPLLTSEIRCLSCRMAMYTKTLEIARYNKFKFVAEGARISQKFFIEQEKFIPRFKELADNFGITLLYPVLHLEDDKEEIKELLANGHSSKTWESKCLLGESAMDKTKEDEDVIMHYYDEHIRPKVLRYLRIQE